MSKDLKKRAFRFAGSTICYAFMQATGMVNDHLRTCLPLVRRLVERFRVGTGTLACAVFGDCCYTVGVAAAHKPAQARVPVLLKPLFELFSKKAQRASRIQRKQPSLSR